MSDESERNRQFVIQHFEDFVNRRDLAAIERNMHPQFLDHDGPGGKAADIATDKAMMQAMYDLFPDLRVEVRDSVAQGDIVVVRNVWTGTQAKTGKRMEFHGFVQWRLQNGKIIERWATVTPPAELHAASLRW